jgi:amino acid transporter
MAIYPTLFIGYLGHFAPAMTAGPRGMAVAVALVAAAAAWNVLGARKVGGSSVLLGIVLLAPFAVVVAIAMAHRTPNAADIPLRQVDFLGGILVAMWNYMGWDNSSTVAGEVDKPQRTYPLAMAFGVALVAVSYVLPIGAVALTGLDPNRWSTGGWADVARAIGGGEVLAFAITLGGMVGAAGTLNALTMSLSRLSFVKLIVLDVLLTGLSILLQFAALVGLRIREPRLHRPYRVPGGMFGAVAIGIPPLVLLILTAVRNKIEPVGPINALELGALLVLAGVLLYYLSPRVRKR